MSRLIINFSIPRTESFRNGFLKGLGAPVSLFGEFWADPRICKFEPEPLPRRSHGTIAEDWRKVGIDIKTAIERG